MRNLWAVSVEALDHVPIATRADSAYVSFIVPSFVEHSVAVVSVLASELGWLNWAGSGTANVLDAFVFDTAWAWSWCRVFQVVSRWAGWFFVFDIWRVLAFIKVAYAVLDWAATFGFGVFSYFEFVTH